MSPLDPEYIDDCLRGYLVTTLWASAHPDTGEPLDDTHTSDDFDPSVEVKARRDVTAFLQSVVDARLDLDDLDGKPASTVGHDLWLTRNGHGAGFWDGDYPTHGDVLTELATAMGMDDLYPGDDGALYLLFGT